MNATEFRFQIEPAIRKRIAIRENSLLFTTCDALSNWKPYQVDVALSKYIGVKNTKWIR
jgi:hypothetical protein